jgi:hypothetical protein
MSQIESVLDDIIAHPLRAAAAGAAIGYVGLDVPPDLLLAAGRIACHLPWDADASTPKAADWLESSFPGWARSMLEDWAAGRFACFDQVVFSRGEDGAHRLYYYVCELQRRGRIRGPRPLIFDIARIPRQSSRQHTVAALRQLSEQLAIDEAGLAAGIDRANGLRRLFGRIETQRRGRGSLYEKIVRASLFADLSTVLRDWSPDDGAAAAGSVLLAGSAPPDDRLHRAVERAGWRVAGELHERSLSRLGSEVDPRARDLMAEVAHRWLQQSFGVRDFADPGQRLMEAVRRTGADAVVLWLTREDEALAWHVPTQRRVLAAAGVPALTLTARRWDARDGAAADIARFLQDLRP